MRAEEGGEDRRGFGGEKRKGWMLRGSWGRDCKTYKKGISWVTMKGVNEDNDCKG